MLLFLTISELILLTFRVVMIRSHNHQYVYWGTISRKIVRKTEELHLPTRHDYFPWDANPVFICHIFIIIVIVIV